MTRKHNIEEVIDHSMGLLVNGVTRIVERIYAITFIRPGWYKLFPQLVISFSFITSLDFARSRDHPSKELGPVSEYPHYVTAAILVFQTNPSLLYFRCIFLLKMLCLLDVLCLLEMLGLLDMLCLLEVLCLLEMLYLLEMLCLLENALLAWGALLTWDALLTWEALLTWDLKGSQR